MTYCIRHILPFPSHATQIIMDCLDKDEESTKIEKTVYDVFLKVVIPLTKKFSVLFLDLDGVMITWENVHKGYKEAEAPSPRGMSEHEWAFIKGIERIEPRAVANLQKILSIPNVAIVLTSSRRHYLPVPKLRELTKDSIGPYILDKTPDADDPEFVQERDSLTGYKKRAAEIAYWLREYYPYQISLLWSYAILDDVDDCLSENFNERFVQVGCAYKAVQDYDYLRESEAQDIIDVLKCRRRSNTVC